ncbi:MAG: hypothetical protein PHY34_03605 [Patescibacteria group bacterium]|nr:hypothetical protein [Patescibacteria group bacterium]MDD5715632.1 hypothetical protein [Patescibacteria group bacterium]
MRYFLGIIFIGVGFVIVWKADWIMNNFGRIAWAEEHLGSEGGTRIMWKFIGIIVIIFAFLYMSGALAGILRGIFGQTITSVNSS